MDLQSAHQNARNYLMAYFEPETGPLSVMEKYTIVTDGYYIVLYQTEAGLNGDESALLCGNVPLIVHRDGGAVDLAPDDALRRHGLIGG